MSTELPDDLDDWEVIDPDVGEMWWFNLLDHVKKELYAIVNHDKAKFREALYRTSFTGTKRANKIIEAIVATKGLRVPSIPGEHLPFIPPAVGWRVNNGGFIAKKKARDCHDKLQTWAEENPLGG